ncbi:energy-coupling factor ABC transporter permease [Archangium violaceum]|uniref:energy-coupling factor ABC transporter permease n=1 Tax=Archangium violaceum TaxID=83451 RepID=UPI001EF0240B|nr:energy-coupling factor ABC transporter permease [Archangium violaceum]
MPGISGRGCGAAPWHRVQALLQPAFHATRAPSRFWLLAALLLLPHPAHAMHLAEGLLPFGWALGWTISVLPLLALGVTRLRQRVAQNPLYSPFVAMLAAAVFVVSCMPVPVPIIGTCSHPCGTGLAAVLIGPVMTVLVTFVALLLQALFLAHGGLTTLGADIWSMGVVGGFVGYGVFHGLRAVRAPLAVAAFAAGMLSDWATYAMTSFELASALHGSQPLGSALGTLLLSFLPTQLPLGILEGALTAGAVVFISRRRPALLHFHALPAPATP